MALYTQEELASIANEVSTLRRGAVISGELVWVLQKGIASGIELTASQKTALDTRLKGIFKEIADAVAKGRKDFGV
jgi:hypothetical protein